MTGDDAQACEGVRIAALADLRARLGMPVTPGAPVASAIPHLLITDPAGGWVAVDGSGLVAGFAQVALREGLWILAQLFVSPATQGAGTGRRLLNRAVEHGPAAAAGLIASSPDARAISLYGRLDGFELHPAVSASGTIDRSQLAGEPGVREGSGADLDFAAELDRRLRGGPHGPDLEHLIDSGAQLLVLPDRGYAIAEAEGPGIVAATDPAAGIALLRECLARTSGPASMRRITAGQQWAIRTALDLGMELRPWGPLFTRGSGAATGAYLSHPAFC